ncbi:hypothetical protein FSP39_019167 [Pinctada imbricata]|uniref:Uncharacterized protein n=1 Tax=Pinctada imbricata TaxID=66713 RepID=A0AA88XN50_PINIB|nr:hypothetical protein FSP39_019167 [Pinctada imbricata]
MAAAKSVIALILSIIAIVFLVGAFASPYWVESFTKSQNKFVKAGLWEFCFDEYTFWKDYNGKIYKGCWYIFSDQYRVIWEWLSPPWFIVCQVMVSVCLLFLGIATLILILLVLNCFPQYLHEVILMGGSFAYFFIVLLVFITGVIFGVKKEDRQWMPRPDQCYLSWSYGFFIISGFFTLFAAFVLLKAGREEKESLKHDYPRKPNY